MFFPDAARLLNSPLLLPEPSESFRGASIDTRTLEPGNLFIALRGEKEDGHRFLASAFEKGAAGALIETSHVQKFAEEFPRGWKNLVPVSNPAEAFLQLAGYFRDHFKLKAAIGIVGSVGKTSTKEFLYYLLRQQYPTLATEGNLNNHLGLPLTLFRLNESHRFSVCELGTNRLGDVRQLAEIFKPDHALLTRIAPEHLEGFGSMDQVYQGELELFESLKPGSYAVIPDDDPVLLKKIRSFDLKWIKVGFSPEADYRLSAVKVHESRVSFKVNGVEFSFPGIAGFLAANAAKALAMAELCGIALQKNPADWTGFQLPAGRFQEQTISPGIRVIFDGYNASPASFDAALETFEELKINGRKFLVFSDMLELGSQERDFHEALGTLIARTGISQAVAYGARSKWSVQSLKRENPAMPVEHVENQKEAAEFLGGKLQKGDALLLKASRGMKVEEVLNYLSGANLVPH